MNVARQSEYNIFAHSNAKEKKRIWGVIAKMQ